MIKYKRNCKNCNKEFSLRRKSDKTLYCSSKCAMSDPELIQKRKDTLISKYGVDNISKIKSIGDKKRKTYKENYIENETAKKRLLEQKKATCLKKYGCESPSQLEEVKNKITETCLKKYGSTHFLNSKEREIKQLEKRYSSFEKINLEFGELGYFIWKMPNSLYSDPINFICPNGHYWKIYLHNWRKGLRCSLCSNKTGSSNAETEIADFLSKFIKIERNNKTLIKPFELDIFIPEKKLAVEFNGLYWHSEKNGKGKNYHFLKLTMAQKANIDLIQIFEDEWIHKQEIIKSVLKSRLGIYNRKIYARNCIIKNVSLEAKNNFLKDNHLQGNSVSSINLGLYYQNELVSLMTFGKRKITSRKPFWEMIRFCNKLNTQIIGAASKLFNYFCNTFTNINELTSYCDRRWFDGKLYENLKFEFKGYSSPNYWYIKNGNRKNRINFQKHKLPKILENFCPDLSEWENMKNHGYDRIWDCGNKVYKYSKKDV
jgi:hypothetical protein